MTIKKVSVTVTADINGKTITKSAGLEFDDGMTPMDIGNILEKQQSSADQVAKIICGVIKGLENGIC